MRVGWRSALGLIVGLGLIGCGGTTGGTFAGTQSAAATKATGTPIVLWMANLETPQLSFANLRLSAQATVDYINNELGGVDGHPLQLNVCTTHFTPASSTACATQIVQAGPVAIIGGGDAVSIAADPIYAKSGIPIIGGAAFVDADLTLPNAFRFDAGSSALSALMVYATRDLHAHHVGVMFPNQVSGISTAKEFEINVLKALGADAVSIAHGTAQADYTPIVQQAISANVDALVDIPPSSACINVMQASRTLASGTPLFLPGLCSGSAVLTQAGSAANGVYFDALFSEWDPNNPDTQLFNTKIAKYVSDKTFSFDDFASYGANAVMNAYHVFSNIGFANLSHQSIIQAFQSSSHAPNFLGYPYTCDGKQAPGRPAMCNTLADVVQYKDGRLVRANSDPISAAQYLAAPAA